MKTLTTILGSLVLVAAAVCLLACVTMVQTFLWYCIDDHLAALLHRPEIGHLPFTFVWPATLLLTGIFGGGYKATVKKE